MASRNAKGRMIYWKISYSKQLSRCSILSKLLFTWLIPNTDDLGRMEGDPAVIKGMVFPYEEKITLKQIKESLEELAQEKLILWYQVENNLYIQFPSFTLYQTLRKDREYKSDYPEPMDLSRHVMTSHDNDSQCHDLSSLARVPAEGKVSEGEGKEKVSEVKESTSKSVKQLFGEKVHLSDQEHGKLVEKNGEQATAQMIEILDNWYLLHGKKPYASDYQTMVTNGWVFKKMNEENQKQRVDKPKVNRPKSFDAIDQWARMTEGMDENE